MRNGDILLLVKLANMLAAEAAGVLSNNEVWSTGYILCGILLGQFVQLTVPSSTFSIFHLAICTPSG